MGRPAAPAANEPARLINGCRHLNQFVESSSRKVGQNQPRLPVSVLEPATKFHAVGRSAMHRLWPRCGLMDRKGTVQPGSGPMSQVCVGKRSLASLAPGRLAKEAG